jgi:acetyl esterase/lipase
MKHPLAIFAFCFTALLATNGAETLVFKTVAGTPRTLLVDKPDGWKPTDKRPAIVFFFGGGWVGGTVKQFQRHSAYLASRGMVGIRVDYRVIQDGDDGPPVMCVEDAKSAMRYVHSHAAELGVDPERIAAGGGSAGGHLAAFAGLVDGLDDPQDDLKVPCKPKALVLYNPVFDNGPGQWGNERVGKRYREFSPAHNVAKGAPPTIIFLGQKDDLIPVKVVTDFEAKMKRVGSRCDVHLYPGVGHGFFNRPEYYTRTIIATDKFLASLGWIQGEPTLKEEK